MLLRIRSLLAHDEQRKCNIPLVKIGIVSEQYVSENDVYETHYKEEHLVMQSLLNTGFTINVEIRTIKIKGISVLSHKEHKSMFGHKIIIMHCSFSL